MRLLDFSKVFVVECDASGSVIVVVLMQDGMPITFLSKALKGRELHLSTYVKELLAIVMAIQMWRCYLLGQPFKIRTDQQSLKYMLEQKIETPSQ